MILSGVTSSPDRIKKRNPYLSNRSSLSLPVPTSDFFGFTLTDCAANILLMFFGLESGARILGFCCFLLRGPLLPAPENKFKNKMKRFFNHIEVHKLHTFFLKQIYKMVKKKFVPFCGTVSSPSKSSSKISLPSST